MCDFDICSDCVRHRETLGDSDRDKRQTDAETERQLSDAEKELEERMMSMLDNDSVIPLIDSNGYQGLPESETDEIRQRPKSVSVRLTDRKPRSFKALKKARDSPDVFNLRAPLVSCENFLTPANSKEMLDASPAKV